MPLAPRPPFIPSRIHCGARCLVVSSMAGLRGETVVGVQDLDGRGHVALERRTALLSGDCEDVQRKTRIERKKEKKQEERKHENAETKREANEAPPSAVPSPFLLTEIRVGVPVILDPLLRLLDSSVDGAHIRERLVRLELAARLQGGLAPQIAARGGERGKRGGEGEGSRRMQK